MAGDLEQSNGRYKAMSANLQIPQQQPFRPLSIADYECLAKERLSRAGWAYYDSGSADEITLNWNRDAYKKIALAPRVCVDVSVIDTRITLLGHSLAHPILLAPTSTHLLAHPEAEVETAHGANAAEAVLIASTVSNRSIEEIARVATVPLWFQLYVEDDRNSTRMLIERAQAAGCTALCITVDNNAHYARNRQDHATREHLPKFPFANLSLSAGVGGDGRKGGRSKLFTWKDLDWILSFAKLPVILKGIMHPDDAELAVQSGAAGLVVSNHGGRALDTAPATIDALRPVVERVAGRMPVLIDGGIRRGGDVLKALALGAAAVLIGRPYLYGLAVAGADGIRDVVEILRAELEAAMALTGRTSIATIDRTVLW